MAEQGAPALGLDGGRVEHQRLEALRCQVGYGKQVFVLQRPSVWRQYITKSGLFNSGILDTKRNS